MFGREIYPKNRPNQTCSCWLITPNQQTPCIETSMSGQLQSTRQLQNNFFNGAMLIKINRVIILAI